MSATPLLAKIDAVTVPVSDLDAGLRFYRDALGHTLRWRNDHVGQAGLALPGSDTELVLTTRLAYETLVLLDLSKGRYVTDSAGNVTGVRSQAGSPAEPDRGEA